MLRLSLFSSLSLPYYCLVFATSTDCSSFFSYRQNIRHLIDLCSKLFFRMDYVFLVFYSSLANHWYFITIVLILNIISRHLRNSTWRLSVVVLDRVCPRGTRCSQVGSPTSWRRDRLVAHTTLPTHVQLKLNNKCDINNYYSITNL